MSRARLSDDEVEALMVPQIVRAIYPVLIPMEQQDTAIQARNLTRMTALARELWWSFADPAARESEKGATAEVRVLRDLLGAVVLRPVSDNQLSAAIKAARDHLEGGMLGAKS